MGTPSEYLPPALSSDLISRHIQSLGLPAPTEVHPLKVAAQYHSIYIVHYQGDAAASAIAHSPNLSLRIESDGSLDFVLRVAGRHLPRIKTLNEVGIMTWIRNNTTIPIPLVINFDASEDNLLHHEYTLLEKAPGISIDRVYDDLSQAAKESLVEQLIDYLAQLHEKQWKEGYIGGLTVGPDGSIAKGPMIDEFFWQVPDIAKYWPPEETVESLNPVSTQGYTSYTDFITASIKHYVHAIAIHDSLESFRDLVPRLNIFVGMIHSDENTAAITKLNDVRYILAHKDMHFGNIMCDPTDPSVPITAVLDWEFSGVVPAPRWNPPRAFLWNTQTHDRAKVDQAALEKIFETKCKEKGLECLLEDAKLTELQEPMQTLTNHLRAIVEVCPRGQAQDRVGQWRSTVEKCLSVLESVLA
jgi:hypothetical protein